MNIIRSLFATTNVGSGRPARCIRSLFATLQVSTGDVLCIRSLFATAIADTTHAIGPQKPQITSVKARQTTTGSVIGRTIIQTDWSQDSLFERHVDNIGKAEDGIRLLSRYAPVSTTPGFILYEVTDDNPVASFATTLSVDAVVGNDIVIVDDASGFVVGEFIRIGDPDPQINKDDQVVKIEAINGNEICFSSKLEVDIVQFSIVKKVDVVIRNIGSDYTIDPSSGQIDLIFGPWTQGNRVIFEYTPVMNEIQSFGIVIIPGENPFPLQQGNKDFVYSEVIGFPDAIIVENNILPSNDSFADTLSSTQNGETFTLYLFSKDVFGNWSYPDTRIFETIPSIPDGITFKCDNQAILLEWNSLSLDFDTNTDGFNIYRSEGDVFVPEEAIQLNNILIPKTVTTFLDSVDNLINRDPLAPLPENAVEYTYKIESEDTVTSWVIGTQNQIGTTPINELAEKP